MTWADTLGNMRVLDAWRAALDSQVIDKFDREYGDHDNDEDDEMRSVARVGLIVVFAAQETEQRA